MQRKSNTTEVTAEQRTTGVNKKYPSLMAVLVSGILLLLYIYYTSVHSTWGVFPGFEAGNMPSTPGLGLVIVFALVGVLAKRMGLKFSFMQKKTDLVVLYIVVAIGALVVNEMLMFFHILIALHSLSRANPSLYGGLLPQLPSWLVPQDSSMAASFLRGGATVAWGKMALPITIWSIVFTVIVWVGLCLLTVVRRQWVEKERLLFPLVTSIVSVMPSGQKEDENDLWNNKMLWIGTILPGIFFVFNTLNSIFPIVPQLSDWWALGQFFPGGVFQPIKDELVFSINPLIIGVSGLLPLDMSFSMVFFYFIKLLTHIGEVAVLGRYDYWAFRAQLLGGALVISVVALWMSRHELKSIVMQSLGRQPKDEDNDEILPPQIAFWGGLIGFLALILFTNLLLKVPLTWTLVFWGFVFSCVLALSRIRAETGYPNSLLVGEIGHFMNMTFGRDRITLSTLGLGFFYTVGGRRFAGLIPLALEGYKMADEADLHKRSITKMIIATVFLTILLTFVIGLPSHFERGANNSPIAIRGTLAFNWLQYNTGLGEALWQWQFVAGLVCASVLSFMRMRFVWWPLHPLGYVTGMEEWMRFWWGPILIGWCIKFFVMRYGGGSLYKRIRPIFAGLILGQVGFGFLGILIRALVQALS